MGICVKFFVNSLRGAVIFGLAPLSALPCLFRRLDLAVLITLTLSTPMFLVAARGELGGGIDLPLRATIPSSATAGGVLTCTGCVNAC